MKPIIGVTSNLDDHNLSVSMDNIHSLINAGAVPIVVPNLLDDDQNEKLAETLDGLLLTGGGTSTQHYLVKNPIKSWAVFVRKEMHSKSA